MKMPRTTVCRIAEFILCLGFASPLYPADRVRGSDPSGDRGAILGSARGKSSEVAKADPKKIWQGVQREKILRWSDATARPITVSQYTVGSGKTLQILPPAYVRGEMSEPRLLVQGTLILGDPDKTPKDLSDIPVFLMRGLNIELDGASAELVVHGIEWRILYTMQTSPVMLKRGNVTIRHSAINGQAFMIDKNWRGRIQATNVLFCSTDARMAPAFQVMASWGTIRQSAVFAHCVLGENYRFDLPLLACMRECDAPFKYSFNASTKSSPSGPFRGLGPVYVADKDYREVIRNQLKTSCGECEIEFADQPFNALNFEARP